MSAVVHIGELAPSQLGELYTLQRAAFVDEALLYETPDVPALTESAEAFGLRHAAGVTLVAQGGARIVGAVSARPTDGGEPEVERLMVAPDRRGEGLGTRLMQAIEERLSADGHTAVRLVVGEIANANRRLYERLGYSVVARDVIFGTIGVLILRKALRGR